ncbi:MAG: site-specific DNA-methyltransferase [Prevotella sp.]|nr:site-specific DNA-methyltransferase [Prevotella sp.]MDY4626103.1 site-specific DNA-methyltransferase [Prevotella sp.]MDY5259507.1 site-specific DNA-methyltransferase [Prevotella sp.]
MPTLNWIGKDKVVSLHNDVPFHVLEHGYGFTADGGKTEVETGSGNKIIHGDNLTALKSLLPEYEGRVDCIYIDPPYNTGNENWVYNDNVNDPRIKRWLGEVVGKEGEDLSRHDKWCCMMYPRLRLLKQLLSEHGVIFISIDDNEYATLHGLCDEILGESNYIATIVWQKRTSPDARRILSAGHEYILIYTKRLDETFNGIHKLSWNEESAKNYKNPDNDPRGPWISTDCTAQAGHGTKNQFYKMITPAGRVIELPDNLCWRFTKQRMDEEIAAGRIWFGVDGRGVPRKKTYLSESEGHNVWTWWPNTEVGHTQEATKELTNILEATAKFDYPKPVRLIKRALEIATNKDSIILDSFAGSGTTAHAVLDLNKKDGGNRKFILIEMMDYADTITAERVKRVMTGYPYKGEKKEEIYSKKLTPKNITQGDKLLAEAQAKTDEEAKNYTKVSKPKIQDNCLKVIGTIVTDEKMPGLGGAFDYYELGPSLFDKDGFLNEDVGEDAIREYVYYSETRQHLTRQRQESSKYLLDTFGGTAYYFYYEPHCMTSLDFKSPLHIAEKADQYIIYADVCYLPDDYMRKHRIIFKKIPRDIRQF